MKTDKEIAREAEVKWQTWGWSPKRLWEIILDAINESKVGSPAVAALSPEELDEIAREIAKERFEKAGQYYEHPELPTQIGLTEEALHSIIHAALVVAVKTKELEKEK